MPDCRDIRLMADYNAWMNGQLYAAAVQLSEAELAAPRGAYFGSLLGTLNHILVGDISWLKRFATHPAGHPALAPLQDTPTPASLDTILHHDLAGLTRHRQSLDAMIVAWAAELRDADLEHSLRYANRLGIVSERHFGSLLLHFFNHQTHHRGQAATLLTQAGVDTGVTDLLVRIPDTLRPD
ncbi:DinB family [Bordetella ansorpii]|jgi:uncharacterized damage-inducible protein DinB|uniref:DinB family n=1 Tax=Bordetella ansorpii TaxID=288768 RepID=A0A146AYL2_9BORD|nr:DinB family protein [Bordetella ansorpii]CZZ95384.1 DinB family [Bordetella ansorpii]